MLDLPLHPIAVHFPIVLGAILPLLGFLLWWAIRKEHLEPKVWILVAVLAFSYAASATVAAELGEDDEEKVEKVVAEDVIEEHEEAAEMVPWIGGTLFLLSLGGLWRKHPDRFRLGLAVLSLAALIPLGNAGHTGGKLVYQYGAANVHLNPEAKAMVQSGNFYVEREHSEHENEDD
ncbi:MAG: DUF2231 domain-containing protein [Nitrospinaceae bacterium]